MEITGKPIAELLEKSEEYLNNAVQLNKLKFLDVFAETCSFAISRLILAVIVIGLLMSATVALALWLGDSYGSYFLGFLAVTAAYLFVALIYRALQTTIQRKINNSIIKFIFKTQ